MLSKEQHVEIGVLIRQGLSIRAIARQMHCSRNTVRRHLKLQAVRQPPVYGPRVERASKLAPFEDYLHQRIDAARPHWIPATVLLREIREQGYQGGYSILTSFLLALKSKSAEPAVRFETEPGEQMQVDFTVIRRGKDPLLAFVATLGWSRATYVVFSRREDSAAWCVGIEKALRHFGGTPRKLLFDNAKAVVLARDAYGPGEHRWNPALLMLAERYGFTPKVCRPYRAQTKGKVERFNHYLKNSFVVPLAASLKQVDLLLNVEVANSKIGPWLTDIANARVHATTGEIPQHRLDTEVHHLLPLPEPQQLLATITTLTQPIPVESLQHPLPVYQSLLEARP
ncbi:IS21 family transposase [Pseudomonas sp. SST3]|uniref:IS21 family transposase n=1 Tax=Pseudomonas sp. SST3 TaxID=2267882 RepID=UPI00144493E2|nr:IS21 family transposase [Pseudomonas sp. SST3]NKQ12723.1 IS21 family transposase [Pseudomonas sp. SST3]